MSGISANEKLIKNLENQLERLVRQLNDLEECKDDLSQEEILEMKEETAEQIKDFTETLERMNKGDLTLNNKLSTMKIAIRAAISKSFKTVEMIKMFGSQDTSELGMKLIVLEEEFRLKKIPLKEMESKKTEILTKLLEQGHSLSVADSNFLDQRNQQDLQQMEQIIDDE